MPVYVALRPKTCSYLKGDGDENNKVKCTKFWIIKGKLKLKD